jgi:hypothetical protein
MDDERKQKLIDLGAEALAEALLKFAIYFEEADDLIEQLVALPEENIRRFREKLSALKHSGRFIDWRGVPGFARELEMLLQDLKSGVDNPLTGVELVASFFEADNIIFEMCDDSSGYIGEVFRSDARELFVDYASGCTDKEKIAEIILRVNKKDSYGIRDTLIDCAGECLPEEMVRSMIATLQKWADKEKAEYGKRHHLRLIESLARQITDAEFLVAVGRVDEAEEYLLKRANQLDGNNYGSLLRLAESMELKRRDLVTSLIYRSLLISILERGYTKAYPHGVRYLKKLDKLRATVSDWKQFNDHETFKKHIIQGHGRKYSFWSKYEEKR